MPFSSFGLHADIVKGIKDLAFTRPTPIQADSIPPAMEGRDVLACAATGSGKTAAFLLPTIHRLMTHPPKHGAGHGGGRMVRALVLTPTRELAAQIYENLQEMATHTPITGAPVYGGVGMGPQEHAFRMGVDILIATPGRLLDHLKRPYAKLSGLEVLIMDEADRMLDMGFLPDIRRILKVLPPPEKRQTLFFSATMPNEIRQLTHELLKNPATIQIERQAAPAVGITQAIYPVPMHLKSGLLLELLKNEGMQSVICFTRTKHRANRLADFLRRNEIACAPIHGNRTQGQRNAALAGFKSGGFRVLVATDIAARGIDVQAVSHVINFDCPHIAEDYIHRVGRTGRASATGDAFTFVSPEEEGDLRVIERAIGKRLPRVTLPGFDYSAKPTEKLEIPIAERIAAIRAQKALERSRREQKMQGGGHGQQGRPQQGGGQGARPHGKPQQGGPGGGFGGHGGGGGGAGQGGGKRFGKKFGHGPGGGGSGSRPGGGNWKGQRGGRGPGGNDGYENRGGTRP
ncbi:MAG TPA: DEAD/DEAH box helicase [Phycisphaerae bacterium]|nr:DEAD/DEAH box helicase [Phycisphaerae bacterium]